MMHHIGDLLSSVWRALRTIIMIVLICVAIYFTFGGAAIVIGGMTFVGGWGALACLGLAMIVDSEVMVEVADKVGTAVGEIAGAVLGATVGGFVGGSNIAVWIIGGVAAYVAFKYFTRDKSKEQSVSAPQTSAQMTGA